MGSVSEASRRGLSPELIQRRVVNRWTAWSYDVAPTQTASRGDQTVPQSARV